MTSQEREYETEAVSLPRLDTVLHLGAGLCSELETYLGRGARRILLVEADPQVAEALERRVAGLSHAEVLSAAVAARAANSVLHRYSVPGFAALHPATGLKGLFPGLREIEAQPVGTLSAAEIIAPLALDGGGGNLLVLEAAGEELPILEALDQSGLLKGFSEIRVRCGRQPLYEGGEPAERILTWLNGRGFDLVSEDAAEDPDWPWWSFRCNPLQARIQKLEALIHQLEYERRGLESSNGALRGQLAQEQRETRIWKESAEAADADHQREVLRLQREQEAQASLLAERDSLLEQLAVEQAELGALIAQRDADLALLRAEQTELSRALQDSQRRAESIDGLRKALEESSKEQREQIASLVDQLEGLQSDASAQERRLADVLQTTQTLELENQGLRAAVAELRSQLQDQQRQTLDHAEQAGVWRAKAQQAAETAARLEAEQSQEVQRLSELHRQQSQLVQEQQARLGQLEAERKALAEGLAERELQESQEVQRLSELQRQQSQLVQEQQARLGQLEAERKALAEGLAEREAEQSQEVQRLSELHRQQSQLAQEQQARLEQLEAERKALAEGLAERGAEQSQEVQRLSELQRQQSQLVQEQQARLEQLEAERKALAEGLAEREAEQSQEVQRLSELHRQQSQLAQEQQARLEQLEAERKALAEGLSERDAALEALRVERDGQVRQCQGLIEQMQSVDALLLQTREELREQQRQTTYWHQEGGNLRQQLEDCQRRFEEQDTEQARRRAGWELSLKEASDARDRAEVQAALDVERAAGLLARAKEKADGLQREIDQTKGHAARLVEENANLDADLKDARAELAEQRHHTEYWMSETSRLKEEAEKLGRQLTDALEPRESEGRARGGPERSAQAGEAEQAGPDAPLAELQAQRSHTKHWMAEAARLETEVAQQKAEAEAQRKEAKAQRERADEIERRLSEKDRRQHLLDEELIKAEAQIDLIKDILIREKAF